MQSMVRRLIIIFVTLLWLAAPRPAAAECLYASVYVTRAEADPIYIHGPDGCVYPTPWEQVFIVPGHLTLTNVPPGAPNGYFVDIRIPFP